MLASYLARTGVTLLGGYRRGCIGILDEARMPSRVGLTDIDTYGHLNNGRFLTLMDFGRLDYSIRTGLFREALKRRWFPVLGSATVKFRRELRLGARFELVTRLQSWDERWFYFEHRFERGGEVCAVAHVRGITKLKGRTVPPAEILASVGFTSAAPVPTGELEPWLSCAAR